MIKSHVEEQVSKVLVVDAFVCNKCGLSISPNDWNTDHVSITKRWGYGSNKDNVEQQVDLCETCWDSLCDSFVVPVTEHDWDNSSHLEESPQLSFDFSAP